MSQFKVGDEVIVNSFIWSHRNGQLHRIIDIVDDHFRVKCLVDERGAENLIRAGCLRKATKLEKALK